MTAVKINARDIIVQIEDATPDSWLTVEHLSGVTINRGENEEVADTSDFESVGAYEQDVMQRGSSLALAGLELKDHLTGALLPGRARVEEMAGEEKVGYDSRARIRFRHPMDTHWKVWGCTVSVGESGGETNAKSAWAASIVKCGRTTLVAVA